MNTLSPSTTYCGDRSGVMAVGSNNQNINTGIGLNKVHHNNCYEKSTTAQSASLNNNTRTVSNNTSIRDNNNYTIATPSKNNNTPESSFYRYNQDGIPYQQQPTSLEALYHNLNANKNGSNNTSNNFTSNHDLQQPMDGIIYTNNSTSITSSAKDMEQQHADNIRNLHSIALQSPAERGFTECLGLIILESIVYKKRGKLTYTNVNNMTLDIDDDQITGLDEPSMVFGGGTKDFLEEVFVHVISDKALVLEFLGGNIEAFQILNYLMDINYDWKNREMAHVMWYEVDIALDIICDTLDIDDDSPWIKSPTLPTYQPPTLLTCIKRAALDESALEGSRPAKKLKHTKVNSLLKRKHDMVEESPLPLRGGGNTQPHQVAASQQQQLDESQDNTVHLPHNTYQHHGSGGGLGGGNPSSYPPNTMQPMNGGSSLNPLLNSIGNNTNLQQPSRAQLQQHIQSQQLQIEQNRLLLQQQTILPQPTILPQQTILPQPTLINFNLQYPLASLIQPSTIQVGNMQPNHLIQQQNYSQQNVTTQQQLFYTWQQVELQPFFHQRRLLLARVHESRAELMRLQAMAYQSQLARPHQQHEQQHMFGRSCTPWRCKRCGQQNSATGLLLDNISGSNLSRCYKCQAFERGKWRQSESGLSHANNPSHDPWWMWEARIERKYIKINKELIVAGRVGDDMFIECEHPGDIDTALDELTNLLTDSDIYLSITQRDQLNIALIQMSLHGKLTFAGKEEKIKSMSGKRLIPDVSMSHEVVLIMKNDSMSNDMKVQECKRVLEKNMSDEGVQIQSAVYYASNMGRAWCVRKGKVYAIGYVLPDGYRTVTLQNIDAKRHDFRLGQMINLLFNGESQEGGKCTTHHENYHRRDNHWENLEWEFLHINSSDHGPGLAKMLEEYDRYKEELVLPEEYQAYQQSLLQQHNATSSTTRRQPQQLAEPVRPRQRQQHHQSQRYVPFTGVEGDSIKILSIESIPITLVPAIRNLIDGRDSSGRTMHEKFGSLPRKERERQRTLFLGEIVVRRQQDSIQRSSLMTLQPETWLNDEIMNYFCKNIISPIRDDLSVVSPSRVTLVFVGCSTVAPQLYKSIWPSPTSLF